MWRRLVTLVLVVAAAASLVALWGLGEPARGFDFSTFYAAGAIATTNDASTVFDRVPEDLSKTPPEGPLARAAEQAGFPAVPGQYFNLPVVLLLYRPLAWMDFATAFRANQAINIAALVALCWISVKLATCDSRAIDVQTAARTEVRGSLNRNAAGARIPSRTHFRGNPFPQTGDSQTPPTDDQTAARTEVLGSLQGNFCAFLCLLIVAAWSHPVRYNVELGNMSVLLALAVVLAYALDRRSVWPLAGLLLGVAIIVKPAPALLLLFFAIRRRWATVLTTLTVVAALLGLGVAVYGTDMHGRWLDIIRWNGVHTFVAWNNQSLLAAVLRFGVPVREIGGWDVFGASPWMIWFQRFVVLIGIAVWIRTILRSRSQSSPHAVFAAGCVLMTLALPFAWTHYLAVLIWPTAILAARTLAQRGPDRVYAAAWLVIVTLCWWISPQWILEFVQRWRASSVGPFATRCLVSAAFVAAVVIFLWLLRRPSTAVSQVAAPRPPAPPAA